ncbi:MAG: hypothetical protein ACI31S_02755 [Bacilli bacterium]
MRRGFMKFISVVTCLSFIFLLTGCGNKTALTSENFKSKMEGNNFVVQDATSQMASYDYITKVYLAIDSSYNYQIEFYELSDAASASSFYNNNKSIFEESKSSSAVETSVSSGNNAKYTLTTNGKYKVVSRINNTVIYVNANDEYKTEVKDLLEELGY